VIAIVVAMKIEAQGLLKAMSQKIIISRECQFICKGTIYEKEVLLIISGVGQVNARKATELILNRFTPDMVISAGIAGGTQEEINHNDIVICRSIHSLGREPIFSDEKMIELSTQVCEREGLRYHIGRTLTVQKPILESEAKRRVGNTPPFPSIVEMESYEVASVTLGKGIPFLTVRTVSDSSQEDARIDGTPDLYVLNKFILSLLEVV